MQKSFKTAAVVFGLTLCVIQSNSIRALSADRGSHGGHAHDTHSAGAHSSADSGIGISMTSQPVKLSAGETSTLMFSVQDREGRPAKGISISHDRILHVIIISEDMSVFAHIHPEDFGEVTREMMDSARFGVRFEFPRAGRYLVAADAAAGDMHVSNHFMAEVSGTPGMDTLRTDLSGQKTFGDYDVKLSFSPAPLIARKEALLRYEISRAGRPVTDLESYLDAPMHIAIVLTDLSGFIHAHGSVPAAHAGHQPVGHIHGTSEGGFGPVIEAKVVFPVKGTYRIFSEVKHEGRVMLMDFMVEVE